jgi:hypothetical protein
MRYVGSLLILAAAVCFVCPLTVQGATAPEIAIFKGDDPSNDGISLGGWGSGSAVKTKEQILDAAWSIKITTQGMYSGAKIEFGQPVTLFADGIDPTRYIQFIFFFKDVQEINPVQGTDYTWADVEPYKKPKVNKMRFVFVSDKGETVEAIEPTGALDPDDNWMRIAVPLAKFKQKEGITSFVMKRFMVFTDIPATFYLGTMKLVTDTAPIKVDPLDPRTIAVMDPQFFVANATAGVSSLKYSWDFDAANGIQAESTEPVAKYYYRTGGEFTVTLTVSDADGLKDPVTVSTTVEVTD